MNFRSTLALPRVRTVLFLIIIATPGVLTLFPGLDRSSTEKRNLAALPALPSFRGLPEYPKGVEAWFNDHFGFRNFFIQSLAWLEWRLFDVSSVKRGLLGRNGWVYYWSENDASDPNEGSTISDFMGKDPYSQAELDQIDSALRRANAILNQMGITFAVLVGPNQSTIYPENLPWWVRSHRGQSRMDQLFAQLRRTGNPVIFPDVRPHLLRAKLQGPVYFSTDTHWTHLGGAVAYEDLMDALQAKRPSLRPYLPSQITFSVVQAPYWGGNAQMAAVPERDRISIGEHLPGQNPFRQTNGNALVFTDSFYDALNPLFTATFNSVTAVHHGWQPPNFDLILKEKPDIVVYVVVERLAMKALPRFSAAVDHWKTERSQDPAQNRLPLTPRAAAP